MLHWKWSSLRLLLFAFLLTFFSSFGQTFFIGLFSDDLQHAVGLDYGTFGSAYAFATLASAILIFWAGALIDRVKLPLYMTGVIVLFALGCVLLSLSSHIATLVAALFLLRFSGQGLFSHIAITTTARAFDQARGRALSICFLGHPTGEAVLPPLFVFLGTLWSWQALWLGIAISLVCLLPVLIFLIGPAEPTHQQAASTAQSTTPEPTGLNRHDVVRDPRFHMLLPSLLTPGFVATGIFIHQSALVLEKEWTASWFALNFTAFAIAQVVGNLIAGQLVDRFTARRLMPLYLLPLGLGSVIVTAGNHPLLATILMAGTGLTTSSASSITNAMWAETYGTRHLGAIRALASSILVISTALSPALFGFLIEGGVRFDSILLYCGLWIAGAAILALRATRMSSSVAR